ncbi:class I SAM-dependent methyltransferase [Micromonospora coerulea]|uniref:class I SAM-dependent methyltransferase n=1 Tax=Micromonospora coerulea TaxID=47856 RepID=UPI001F196D11|nr:class I SAM-dependent methyltransferase [Micromonospora veneta]
MILRMVSSGVSVSVSVTPGTLPGATYDSLQVRLLPPFRRRREADTPPGHGGAEPTDHGGRLLHHLRRRIASYTGCADSMTVVEFALMPASQLSRGFAVTARNGEVDSDEPDDNDYDFDYDEIYRDTADSGGPPWDIGGPQPALAQVLDDGVKGPKVLDVGCGAGDLAIALARRGYEVTAIDISRVAIDMARAKAAAEGLTVHFEVQDATDLSLPSAPFDSVFDSGLLHSLHRRGGGEVDEYLALLPGLAAPGATVFVLAVSLQEGQGWGVTEDLLRAGFAEPEWVDTEVEEIDVAAETGGRELVLPGFLLRTVRASTPSPTGGGRTA